MFIICLFFLKTNFGRIPANLSGKTFSHVFNTTTTSLERLIIEREIKGPCWIEISNAGLFVCLFFITYYLFFLDLVEIGVSHCKYEYEINGETLKSINVIKDSVKLPIPLIKVLSINILTALNTITNEQSVIN